ncbi:NADH-quinone oxidoreductase subunit NuoN [Geminicoccus flavidas]|uniref:NADH-quinone oxidoreductase subunit NuoN n=1 Tax=Geminicoccus flavidas TaxID=2506407 RepID=UPI00135AB4B9|nr:NADH-quinone oxidoreductase subunit NuoN [Geminicoccus flavidas]
MTPAPLLDLMPALPEFLLLLAGLIFLVVGVLREGDGVRLIGPLSAMSLLIAAAIILASDKTAADTFGGHFRMDAFAAFLKVLIFVGVAGAILVSQNFLEDERIARFEFPLLALFGALGMGMMVSANSFLALYMSLELQSLSVYVLAAGHRDTLRSTEAGLKYFILGSLASGLLLYGISLVYGFTGTVMFDQIGSLLRDENASLSAGALVGLVFIAAGICFKLGVVPFHMWTPDVYEGAPTPIGAYIASAPKLAAMGLLLRVLIDPFGAWVDQWQQIIVFVAIASMLLGAFAAIMQSNFKRLMAYSGIANIGYALVGLAAGTRDGVDGVLVFMAIYMVMTLGTFACILAMRRQGSYVEDINELAGLSRRQPVLAMILTVLMFSLAGIPPTAGFFGKFYVFKAAIDADLTWLAVIGLLSSVVACYYYLRIVKLVWFDQAAEPFDLPLRPAIGAVAGISAILLIVAVLAINPLFASAGIAASAIFH